jgi:hypothetical protein
VHGRYGPCIVQSSYASSSSSILGYVHCLAYLHAVVCRSTQGLDLSGEQGHFVLDLFHSVLDLTFALSSEKDGESAELRCARLDLQRNIEKVRKTSNHYVAELGLCAVRFEKWCCLGDRGIGMRWRWAKTSYRWQCPCAATSAFAGPSRSFPDFRPSQPR